jgi:hypothetical protein
MKVRLNGDQFGLNGETANRKRPRRTAVPLRNGSIRRPKKPAKSSSPIRYA